MGTWGLIACSFVIGLCVGQIVLALFLGLLRKEPTQTITSALNASPPEHETLIIITPTRY
jgi:hypothetical protein